MESLTEDSGGRDDIQLSFNSTVALRRRNAPVTGVLLLDISHLSHLSSLIFHLSSFILNSHVGLHPKDYRHKMRSGSEVYEQMPYQMVVAEGLHRVEYCADGVEYST